MVEACKLYSDTVAQGTEHFPDFDAFSCIGWHVAYGVSLGAF